MVRTLTIGLILSLALLSGTSHGFEVFQDPNDVGQFGAAPVQVPLDPNGTTSLNLYYRVLGAASSVPSQVCVSGDGAEVCAWDVHISGSGGLNLVGFTPDPGADIVAHISGNVLRFNGGDPINGELLAFKRLGTLNVSASSTGSATVSGNLFVTAALATAPVPTGALLAETSGPDADGDGVADAIDNCPTVSNAGQQDTDSVSFTGTAAGPDGMGDACDNCVQVNNPRVCTPGVDCAAYLAVAANNYKTLTGGQRDDDHDGWGNNCDGDYDNVGLVVGGNDITLLKASLGKLSSADTCGVSGTMPCAIFDCDEVGLVVGGNDIPCFSAKNGKLNTSSPIQKCAACPLPCDAGSGGNCVTPWP